MNLTHEWEKRLIQLSFVLGSARDQGPEVSAEILRLWMPQQARIPCPSPSVPVKESGNSEKQREFYSVWPQWGEEQMKGSGEPKSVFRVWV